MSSIETAANKIPLLGLIISLLSAGLFGVCTVIVKKVEDVDPFTIAFYRFVGIALSSWCVLIYMRKDPFPRGNRIWLVVRSIMGASNLIIYFYGLKHMPIADTNMIAAASPVWCVLFARIFLKEPINTFDIVNVFITLTGIVFIIRPPFLFGYDPEYVFDDQYFVAAVIVFLGSFLQANVYIVLRLLKGLHYSVTLTNFGTIGGLESAVFMFSLGDRCVPACGQDRYLLVAIGLLSFIAQIGLTVSLQIEEASKISLMRKSGDILFAFLFQILIFHEIPGTWSILGACLVALAVMLSSIKKMVDKLPAEHWLARLFCGGREGEIVMVELENKKA